MGDYSAMEEFLQVFADYRAEISKGIEIARDLLREDENLAYFIGGASIPDTLVGTLTSIFMNSHFFNQRKIVIGFADSGEKVKVSARTNMNINLSELIGKVVGMVGGESGGHPKACGAFIPKGKEEEFIELLKGEISGKS